MADCTKLFLIGFGINMDRKAVRSDCLTPYSNHFFYDRGAKEGKLLLKKIRAIALLPFLNFIRKENIHNILRSFEFWQATFFRVGCLCAEGGSNDLQFGEQFSEVSTGNSIGFFHLLRGQVIEARACLIHRFHTCIDGRNSNILTLKGLKFQSKTKHFDFIDLSLIDGLQ